MKQRLKTSILFAFIFLVTFSSVFITVNGPSIALESNQLVKETEDQAFKLPRLKSKAHFFDIMSQYQNINTQISITTGSSEIVTNSEEAVNEDSIPVAKSGSDFTGTNNQVQGVDEGDIVKTDGKYIYKIDSNQDVIIIEAKPEAPRLISKIDVNSSEGINELFLADNKLIILSNSWEAYPSPTKPVQPIASINSNTIKDQEIDEKYAISMDDIVDEEPMIMPPYYGGENQTKVYIYSIEDIKKPMLIKKFTFDGTYVSGRTIGSDFYFVTNKNMYNDWYRILEDDSIITEDIILPGYEDHSLGEKVTLDYKDIQYFPKHTEPIYMITVGLQLNDLNIKPDVQAYLGSSGTLYVSKDQLFTTVSRYDEKSMSNSGIYEINTEIYKFNLDKGKISPAGNGEVPGTIVNQFSMDVFEDNFRIATTTGFSWDDNNPSKNNLYVLDKDMNVIGKLEGLAEGETIYSTRFMGERVYMVTFKQVDPLFVIDASIPNLPKVLGYLKIPGFSKYLHPVDENHLLGFGYDTKEEFGRVTTGGLKLALFDVTNPLKPIEKQSQVLGKAGSNSDLLWNHKALMFSKENEIMAFPVQITGTNYQVQLTGAMIYKINNEGFSQKAIVSHFNQNAYPYGYDWRYAINRIIYIDGYIYTLSEGMLQVYNGTTFKFVSELEL